MDKANLNPALDKYVNTLESEFQDISPERIVALNQLGDYIIEEGKKEGPIQLVFICIHNSRRSHFGQVWAATAAYFFGLDNIATFSGGTGSTAFNPRAVEAFKRTGFEVSILDENNGNPEYSFKGGDELVIQPLFSKKYNDPPNPASDFTAIMVCSQADEACPFVPGASARFAITYDDPKIFDGTVQESEKYDERCRQIAREIFYTMNYVKSNLPPVI